MSHCVPPFVDEARPEIRSSGLTSTTFLLTGQSSPASLFFHFETETVAISPSPVDFELCFFLPSISNIFVPLLFHSTAFLFPTDGDLTHRFNDDHRYTSGNHIVACSFFCVRRQHCSGPTSQMATNEDTTSSENAQWLEEVEEQFISLCLDQKRMGKLDDKTTFQSTTWREICIQFYRLTHRQYTIKQLKSKFTRLRASFRLFNEMRYNCSGFGWDEDRGILTASEIVWETYFESHSKHKVFKNKGCPNYKMLAELFENSSATGFLARSSTQYALESDEERDLEDEFMNQYPPSRKRQGMDTSEGGRSSKKSRGSSANMEQLIEAMTAAQVAKAERYKQKAARAGTSSSSSPKKDYSIAKCMSILNTMDDLTPELFALAA